jgi:hypothetical protein
MLQLPVLLLALPALLSQLQVDGVTCAIGFSPAFACYGVLFTILVLTEVVRGG